MFASSSLSGTSGKIAVVRSERAQAAASVGDGRITEGSDHLKRAWDAAGEATRHV